MAETAAGKYGSLSHEQLVALLEKRDRAKRLGLVWERDEIAADRALEAQFVAADLVEVLSDPAVPSNGWRNLVIEGDNYDALRWLRMAMRGRVKCIYIDPPYNTGAKDWVYNDNYIKKEDRWRHSTWLEFLYRRFEIARDLLTEDGVMLISINDENRAKLELLLDEVMPGMRKGSLVWRTRVGGNEGGEAFLSDNHEHILVYGKAGFRFGGTEKSYDMYKYEDLDGERYRISDLTVAVAHNDKRAGQAYYPLHDPHTDIYYPANPDRVWAFASRAKSGPKARVKTKFMEDWVAAGRIAFPDAPKTVRYETLDALLAGVHAGETPPFIREDLPYFENWVGRTIGFGTPGFKRYLKDLKHATQPLSSWIIPRSERETSDGEDNFILSGTNDEGAKAIKAIFGEKAFNYAKPPSLIQGLLAQASSPGDLILDFFAGSATTAQAVMALNAQDGGDRQFVMVSSTERTDEAPDRNIAEQVAAERLRRLNASKDKEYSPLDAPFAYLRMRQLAIEDLDYELTTSQAWIALETIHGLPITPYDEAVSFNVNQTDSEVLLLIERPDAASIDAVRGYCARRLNVFVYSWAPGQLAGLFDGLNLELRSIRETLMRSFRQ